EGSRLARGAWLRLPLAGGGATPSARSSLAEVDRFDFEARWPGREPLPDRGLLVSIRPAWRPGFRRLGAIAGPSGRSSRALGRRWHATSLPSLARPRVVGRSSRERLRDGGALRSTSVIGLRIATRPSGDLAVAGGVPRPGDESFQRVGSKVLR